jgi:uncharacterized protein (TIGR00725 family)
MRKTIVGVMGGSSADARTKENAYEIGRLIAENGWVLVSGGRQTGVMQASVSGAHDAGGLTIGVLYDEDRELGAKGLDIVLPTGLGAGRNIINVLSSDVVVACRGTGGTTSEIALALRFGRPVVLLDFDPGEAFLSTGAPDGKYSLAKTPAEAAEMVAGYLKELGRI